MILLTNTRLAIIFLPLNHPCPFLDLPPQHLPQKMLPLRRLRSLDGLQVEIEELSNLDDGRVCLIKVIVMQDGSEGL